jgi:hypothetical protein
VNRRSKKKKKEEEGERGKEKEPANGESLGFSVDQQEGQTVLTRLARNNS